MAPVTWTLNVQLPPMGIERPAGKVTLVPPGVAKGAPTPPQVVLTLGNAAIKTPAGRLSVSGAVNVLSTVLVLLSVTVNVETPPALIVFGAKLLLSNGSPATWQTEITALSIVTAPLRAKTLPVLVAPVFKVMLESAIRLPTKAVVVPSVAELPTCQNTLQLCPPLITFTAEALAVVNALPT